METKDLNEELFNAILSPDPRYEGDVGRVMFTTKHFFEYFLEPGIDMRESIFLSCSWPCVGSFMSHRILKKPNKKFKVLCKMHSPTNSIIGCGKQRKRTRSSKISFHSTYQREIKLFNNETLYAKKTST